MVLLGTIEHKHRNTYKVLINVFTNVIVATQQRKRVSFVTKQVVTKPVKVKFKTTSGKKISFKATKPVTKKIKVSSQKEKRKNNL